jgi:hypothetical protein
MRIFNASECKSLKTSSYALHVQWIARVIGLRVTKFLT